MKQKWVNTKTIIIIPMVIFFAFVFYSKVRFRSQIDENILQLTNSLKDAGVGPDQIVAIEGNLNLIMQNIASTVGNIAIIQFILVMFIIIVFTFHVSAMVAREVGKQRL